MSQTSPAPQRGQFERIGEGIKELFFKEREAEAPTTPAPMVARQHSKPAAPVSQGETEDSVSSQVGALLAQSPKTSAGKLQVLGLDKIRARLGPRWQALSDRIYATMEKTIRRRLTQADVCTRVGEQGYVILFHELAREEAELKCAAIAEEVWEQILGEEEAADYVEVKSLVVNVDGAAVIQEVNPLAGLERLFDDADQGAATAAPPAPQPASRKAGADDFAAGLRCAYRPIWDVHRNALLTFQCEPLCGGGVSALRESRQAEILQLDQFVLFEVAGVMRRLAATKRRFLVSCCVHYETLSRTSSRMVHAALCREIPEDYRQYIVFEIIDVPEHLPRIRLEEIVSGLRGYSRTIRCRADLDWVDFNRFRGTGIEAIGLDLANIDLPEAMLIAQLNSFSQKVRAAGFAPFVHGVNTTSLATSCVAAGFAHLDGNAVRGRINAIENAYRYESVDLLTRLLQSLG